MRESGTRGSRAAGGGANGVDALWRVRAGPRRRPCTRPDLIWQFSLALHSNPMRFYLHCHSFLSSFSSPPLLLQACAALALAAHAIPSHPHSRPTSSPSTTSAASTRFPVS